MESFDGINFGKWENPKKISKKFQLCSPSIYLPAPRFNLETAVIVNWSFSKST